MALNRLKLDYKNGSVGYINLDQFHEIIHEVTEVKRKGVTTTVPAYKLCIYIHVQDSDPARCNLVVADTFTKTREPVAYAAIARYLGVTGSSEGTSSKESGGE